MVFEAEYEEIIAKIIAKYGKNAQVIQCIEEMSELTKELTKNINRDEKNEKNIEDEIADVLLTIIQQIIIYDFDVENIIKIMKKKLKRQNKRMGC